MECPKIAIPFIQIELAPTWSQSLDFILTQNTCLFANGNKATVFVNIYFINFRLQLAPQTCALP